MANETELSSITMEQLTQKLRTGELRVQQVPPPAPSEKSLLVRNHYSLISAGTEGSTVKTARKSLIGKAKERPQQVKQVLDVLKSQGPLQTYRAIMKKLDAYSPLGYSCAGEVIAVGTDVQDFAIGDLVACAGANYANHAEVVCVPTTLCVRLPAGADLKAASYNTLGAIALQGVRQADLRLGESCAVIGLGLIGQLTCLLLRASGVRAYGIDLDEAAVAVAREHSADDAWIRTHSSLVDEIGTRTSGLGADAVIITAGTSSLDPINLAGELARKKGVVVVVGAVPTGFDRDPHYYRKELELRMSCSYGPGRYDPSYEEKGIDYPSAYVRWTENRNMQAFQELIHSHRIDLNFLTTHEFSLENASDAYELIVEKTEPFLGIVIGYDTAKPLAPTKVIVREHAPAGQVGIAFIGAGSYAQSHLLPNLPRHDRSVALRGVMTASGTTSKRVAERFGFGYCTSDRNEILEDGSVNTIFVATRHDSHYSLVEAGLKAGKHVFVEKPLCLHSEELESLATFYGSLTDEERPQLMVGFNRRFAPHAIEVKNAFNDSPMAMLYRVNSGSIPADSWIQDPQVGGGRIIGEACHFIDLFTWLCGSLPTSVHSAAIPDPHGLHDTVNINITFQNGSIGTLCYFANGSRDVPKEYLEVHQSGVTAILRDFREYEIFRGSKRRRRKGMKQDKGQANMVQAFVESVKHGGKPLIPFEELVAVAATTFQAVQSMRLSTNLAVHIGPVGEDSNAIQ